MSFLIKKTAYSLLAGILTMTVLLTGCAGSYEKKLEVASKLFNKACPVMVDDVTRLDNTEVLPGKTFRYNYTLIGFFIDDLEAIDSTNKEEFISQMGAHLLEAVRTNQDLAEFRDNDVTMEYNYHDQNGTSFHLFRFTPDMYE